MTEPEQTITQGNCRAAIFANEIKQNGDIKIIKNARIQKRYKDGEGNWQSTNSYGANDLPKLIAVAMKAYDYLTSRKEKGAD